MGGYTGATYLGPVTYAVAETMAAAGCKAPIMLDNGILVQVDDRLSTPRLVPAMYTIGAGDWAVLTELDPASYTPGSPPTGWSEDLTNNATVTVSGGDILLTATYDGLVASNAKLNYMPSLSAGDEWHIVAKIGSTPQGGTDPYLFRINDDRRGADDERMLVYAARSDEDCYMHAGAANAGTVRAIGDEDKHVEWLRFDMDGTNSDEWTTTWERVDLAHSMVCFMNGEGWYNTDNLKLLQLYSSVTAGDDAENTVISVEWLVIYKDAA